MNSGQAQSFSTEAKKPMCFSFTHGPREKMGEKERYSLFESKSAQTPCNLWKLIDVQTYE